MPFLAKQLLWILALLLSVSCHKSQIPQNKKLVISYQSLDKTNQVLPDYLEGRKIIINLWAPWCESCIEEIPSLKSLSQQEDSIYFRFLSFKDENIEEINKVAQKLNIHSQTGVIDKAELNLFFKSNNMILPSTLLIGKNYKVLKVWKGKISSQQIIKYLGEHRR